jgi:hypothetical protein
MSRAGAALLRRRVSSRDRVESRDQRLVDQATSCSATRAFGASLDVATTRTVDRRMRLYGNVTPRGAPSADHEHHFDVVACAEAGGGWSVTSIELPGNREWERHFIVLIPGLLSASVRSAARRPRSRWDGR